MVLRRNTVSDRGDTIRSLSAMAAVSARRTGKISKTSACSETGFIHIETEMSAART
jgi:hypothetical protein